MRISRKALTSLVVVAMLVVGVAASIAWFYPQLPDPRTADMEGLIRWMVLRDLRQESMETRLVLACRFEEELCAADETTDAFDWVTVEQRLDPSQRQRLWDNLPVVLKPWFLDKVERYESLSPAEQLGCLDRLLDLLSALDGIESIRPEADGSGDASTDGDLKDLLLAQVEQWKQDASPGQREKIDHFLVAIQTRWFLRKLGFPAAPR